MPIIPLSGKDLRDLVKQNLGGYANAASPASVLNKLNEGKDALWAILKSLGDQYVTKYSQSTTSADDDYFGPLSTSSREYDLPVDFRHIRYIEVSTSGYEDVDFKYRRLDDVEFQAVRKASTAQGANSGGSVGTYLYTIYGKNKLLLAQWPEAAIQPVLFYEFWIPDFEDATEVTDILLPYTKKIADYAAKKLTLTLDDPSLFEEWQKQWREEVIQVAMSAAPRNMADPLYVEDFIG